MSDLPECKYRRFTRRPGLLRLHCFLKRDDCIQEECQECSYATLQTGQLQKLKAIVPLEKKGNDLIETEPISDEVGYYSETDPNQVALNVSDEHWIVDHSNDPTWRSDLQAIQASLPKYKPGRDRRFTIESDGSIIYAEEEGEWEPPRDIKGYERDPENPWRFVPLWPVCLKRKPKGKRTGNCGCIQVTMFCKNSDSELFSEEVTHEQCQQCSVRDLQKGD